MEIFERKKQRRILPDWIIKGGKKSEPTDTEKTTSAEAEKNDSQNATLVQIENVKIKRKTIDKKEKGVKNANLKKVKIIIEKKEKGVKNANLKDKPKPVNLKCVGQKSKRVNMPSPNFQPQDNIMQPNHQAFQKTMSSNTQTTQKDLPDTTTTSDIVTSHTVQKTTTKKYQRMKESPPKNKDAKEDKPAATATMYYMQKMVTHEPRMMEEWPEEDSDKEMESEMIKLQIEHETEKEERMKRVEMRGMRKTSNSSKQYHSLRRERRG